MKRVMETTNTRKRIEYRASLKVIRHSELLPVMKIHDHEKKVDGADVKKTQIPVDHRGYIKCKKHDFF